MSTVIGAVATTPTLKTPGFRDPNQVPGGTEAQKELGRVDAVLELNGVLYVGGNYSNTFDNSTGTPVTEIVSYISAWRTDNWARIKTWTVTMPGRVFAISATPDGSTLLIGGESNGLAAYTPLASPTDANTPSPQTVPTVLGGNVQALAVPAGSSTVCYVIGNLTSLGGHGTVGAARMTKSGTTWSVDTGFTCPGTGGTVKCGVAKADGSKIAIGGDFNGAVLAFSGSTGLASTWAFSFTTAEGEGPNQSCICMATGITDDGSELVAAGGDFGPNMYFVTDWVGAGPSNFSISAGFTPAGYWYHTDDGNVQALTIGQMNGKATIWSGHHGSVAATGKNTGSPTTASHGLYACPWTNAGGNRLTYGDPPSFDNPSGTSTPLKVWSLSQSPASGTLHVGGDFTACNGGALNSNRRYAGFAASVTTPPPPPTKVPGALKSFPLTYNLGLSVIQSRLDEMLADGCQHVKAAMSWPTANTASGTYAWSTFDNVVAECEKRGMTYAWHCIGQPAWSGTAGGNPNSSGTFWCPPRGTAQLADYATFVTALVTRYGSQPTHYEVWNEPDQTAFWKASTGSSATQPGTVTDDYAAMLHTFYTTAKAVNPDAKICAPNMSHCKEGFLNALYLSLQTAYTTPVCQANHYFFDYLGMHPYVNARSPSNSGQADSTDAWGTVCNDFNDWIRVQAETLHVYESADKTVILNEFGYSTGSGSIGPVADATRATYVPLAYTAARADPNVDILSWFTIFDATNNPNATIEGTATETAYAAVAPGLGGSAPVQTPGTVSVVQENQKQLTPAAASFTISLPAPATPGNAILIAVSAATVARRLGTTTDDASNTYTKLFESGTTNAGNVLVWIAFDVAGGQNVTVPWSTSTSTSTAIIQELAGLDGTIQVAAPTPLDITTAAGTAPTPSIMTTDAAYLVAAIGMKNSTADPYTSSAGWNESTQENSQNGTALGLAGIVQQTPGTYQNTFTANSGTGAYSLGIVALGLSNTPPPPPPPPGTKPIFGFNSGPTGNNVWTPASTAVGGVVGYRSYGTPTQNIPSTYPGTGTPPAGVKLRVSSLKPDVPTFINGTTLDAQWSAWCAKAPAGDMVTLWHEGESNDGWTASQIIALHKKAYDLAKAANPNVLYGQIFTSASAFSGNFGFPIQNWVATRTDGGPLDYYGIDAYGPNPAQHSILDAITASVAGIQAVVPNAKFGVFEANAIGSHVTGSSDAARAQEFSDAWSYCVANNFLTFFPFFFPEGSTNSFNYDWDPGDSATIAELSLENSQSLFPPPPPPPPPNSYTIPTSGALEGKYLSILESAVSSTGQVTQQRSASVGPVAAAGSVPVPQTPPIASSSQVQGGTTITWQDATFTAFPTSISRQVQQRPHGGAASTITNISGQTGQQYASTLADIGNDVRLEETATNSHGTSSAIFSDWTSIVAPVTNPPVSPTITMTNPVGDATIIGDAGTAFTVTGNAVSDSAITTVFVNGQSVAFDANGNFTRTISLSLGANVITEVAVDMDGDTTTNSQTVTLTAQSGGGGGGGGGTGGGGTGGSGEPITTSDDVERIQTELHQRGVD